MTARTVLGLAAALLLTATTAARADGPVPQAFRSLKAYQVVEQVMAQREVLNLTEQQFASLDELTLAIQTEKHTFTHQGGKPHNTQHVPMVSRQHAYDRAMAILTTEQRELFEALNQAPALVDRAQRRATTPHGKP